jgi:hypothetical protein
MAQDGAWTVEWCPWLPAVVANRGDALAGAGEAIARWLEVDPTAFDVELA